MFKVHNLALGSITGPLPNLRFGKSKKSLLDLLTIIENIIDFCLSNCTPHSSRIMFCDTIFQLKHCPPKSGEVLVRETDRSRAKFAYYIAEEELAIDIMELELRKKKLALKKRRLDLLSSQSHKNIEYLSQGSYFVDNFPSESSVDGVRQRSLVSEKVSPARNRTGAVVTGERDANHKTTDERLRTHLISYEYVPTYDVFELAQDSCEYNLKVHVCEATLESEQYKTHCRNPTVIEPDTAANTEISSLPFMAYHTLDEYEIRNLKPADEPTLSNFQDQVHDNMATELKCNGLCTRSTTESPFLPMLHPTDLPVCRAMPCLSTSWCMDQEYDVRDYKIFPEYPVVFSIVMLVNNMTHAGSVTKQSPRNTSHKMFRPNICFNNLKQMFMDFYGILRLSKLNKPVEPRTKPYVKNCAEVAWPKLISAILTATNLVWPVRLKMYVWYPDTGDVDMIRKVVMICERPICDCAIS